MWREIAKYTGIRVDPDDTKNEGDDLDTYTLDPTTSLSTVQSADYLKGIIIGTGEKGFELMPSDDVLELVDIAAVKEWYSYITDVVLREINHPCSGFHSAFQSYFYDQVAFGNSGIGTFKNELKNNPSANALIFKEYGVDTIEMHIDSIDENDVVLIHDDLLATGGTAKAAYKLVEYFHPKKIYMNFIVEIRDEGLHGRDLFEGIELTTLMVV